MDSTDRIRWAPRIRPELLKRLYEEESRGLLDERLVDDVGIRLLLRCQSVLQAMRGEVECPRCGRVFRLTRGEHGRSAAHTACPSDGCGWGATWRQYRQSIRDRRLLGADSIVPIFEKFVDDYPHARSVRDKALLIDRLIHEFHWDAKQHVPNRSVTNNLIEGNKFAVVEFLDQLSALDPAAKERWRSTLGVMYARRRKGRAQKSE